MSDFSRCKPQLQNHVSLWDVDIFRRILIFRKITNFDRHTVQYFWCFMRFWERNFFSYRISHMWRILNENPNFPPTNYRAASPYWGLYPPVHHIPSHPLDASHLHLLTPLLGIFSAHFIRKGVLRVGLRFLSFLNECVLRTKKLVTF